MLVLDQVKSGDFRLRCLAAGFFAGMLILLGGVWNLQIISQKKYVESQKIQSFRTVRVPAARGKILDRTGNVLVENHPRYTVNLYLEDIRERFKFEYTNTVRPTFIVEKGRKPTVPESYELQKQARYRVVSNIVWQVSAAVLPQPLVLNPFAFEKHYLEFRAMPLPIAADLNPDQIALFMERAVDLPGIELEVEPYRYYPHGPLAAHALGYVQKEQELNKREEELDIRFSYRLPDYQGMTGLENGFEEDLRGKAGAKAILVNNIGYRQREEKWIEPEPGKNLVLTLDLEIQKAAEKALLASGTNTRGAAVVMNCRTGDILAMASVPAYDPNMFVNPRSFSREDWERLKDTVLAPQYNRALQGAYHPGSIFKIIVALAGFEAGVMDLETTVHNPGYYMVGRRRIADKNAPVGDWAFMEAFKRSANTYFIDVGLKAGVDRVVEMGHQFGLGEKTGVVQPRLEVRGHFPKVGARTKADGTRWMDGDTANLCIGQGEVTVTPLQMASMTAAVANGGSLLRPRLVMQLEEQEAGGRVEALPPVQVERTLAVQQKHLEWVRRAMLADVEEEHGTGRGSYIAGMGISGKTGTAQVRTPHGMDHITWFVSFAPFEAPKYVVVVMVESGSSGGGTCAPKAKEIYKAIQKIEQARVNQIAHRE